MRLGKHAVVELLDRKAGFTQGELEAGHCGLRVGTEAVVTKGHCSIHRQAHGRLVVPVPYDRRRHSCRLDEIDAGRVVGQEADHPEPHQALDHTRVVAKRENEERVREQASDQRRDKDIAGMRVAEGGAALELGRPINEFDGMPLHLFDVPAEIWIPAVRNEAGEGASQLDWKRSKREVDRPVLADVEHGLRAAQIVANQGGA